MSILQARRSPLLKTIPFKQFSLSDYSILSHVLGQVIYMTGWREHESQQKAKRRGSATVSFKDIQKEFGGQTT
ncbi:hypothetical protein HanHA300_Chr10g0375171 [Helianthus annuus]|nr:hypothetical protein HanHA300_Chr10g0375171 [Helianthus annuus]